MEIDATDFGEGNDAIEIEGCAGKCTHKMLLPIGYQRHSAVKFLSGSAQVSSTWESYYIQRMRQLDAIALWKRDQEVSPCYDPLPEPFLFCLRHECITVDAASHHSSSQGPSTQSDIQKQRQRETQARSDSSDIFGIVLRFERCICVPRIALIYAMLRGQLPCCCKSTRALALLCVQSSCCRQSSWLHSTGPAEKGRPRQDSASPTTSPAGAKQITRRSVHFNETSDYFGSGATSCDSGPDLSMSAAQDGQPTETYGPYDKLKALMHKIDPVSQQGVLDAVCETADLPIKLALHLWSRLTHSSPWIHWKVPMCYVATTPLDNLSLVQTTLQLLRKDTERLQENAIDKYASMLSSALLGHPKALDFGPLRYLSTPLLRPRNESPIKSFVAKSSFLQRTAPPRLKLLSGAPTKGKHANEGGLFLKEEMELKYRKRIADSDPLTVLAVVQAVDESYKALESWMLNMCDEKENPSLPLASQSFWGDFTSSPTYAQTSGVIGSWLKSARRAPSFQGANCENTERSAHLVKSVALGLWGCRVPRLPRPVISRCLTSSPLRETSSPIWALACKESNSTVSNLIGLDPPAESTCHEHLKTGECGSTAVAFPFESACGFLSPGAREQVETLVDFCATADAARKSSASQPNLRSDVGVEALLKFCSPEALHWLLVSLFLEAKVLVVSASAGTRSAAAVGLRDAIAPFLWYHPFLPICPCDLKPDELWDSPVPLIITAPHFSSKMSTFLMATRRAPSVFHETGNWTLESPTLDDVVCRMEEVATAPCSPLKKDSPRSAQQNTWIASIPRPDMEATELGQMTRITGDTSLLSGNTSAVIPLAHEENISDCKRYPVIPPLRLHRGATRARSWDPFSKVVIPPTRFSSERRSIDGTDVYIKLKEGFGKDKACLVDLSRESTKDCEADDSVGKPCRCASKNTEEDKSEDPKLPFPTATTVIEEKNAVFEQLCQQSAGLKHSTSVDFLPKSLLSSPHRSAAEDASHKGTLVSSRAHWRGCKSATRQKQTFASLLPECLTVKLGYSPHNRALVPSHEIWQIHTQRNDCCGQYKGSNPCVSKKRVIETEEDHPRTSELLHRLKARVATTDEQYLASYLHQSNPRCQAGPNGDQKEVLTRNASLKKLKVVVAEGLEESSLLWDMDNALICISSDIAQCGLPLGDLFFSSRRLSLELSELRSLDCPRQLCSRPRVPSSAPDVLSSAKSQTGILSMPAINQLPDTPTPVITKSSAEIACESVIKQTQPRRLEPSISAVPAPTSTSTPISARRSLWDTLSSYIGGVSLNLKNDVAESASESSPNGTLETHQQNTAEATGLREDSSELKTQMPCGKQGTAIAPLVQNLFTQQCPTERDSSRMVLLEHHDETNAAAETHDISLDSALRLFLDTHTAFLLHLLWKFYCTIVSEVSRACFANQADVHAQKSLSIKREIEQPLFNWLLDKHSARDTQRTWSEASLMNTLSPIWPQGGTLLSPMTQFKGSFPFNCIPAESPAATGHSTPTRRLHGSHRGGFDSKTSRSTKSERTWPELLLDSSCSSRKKVPVINKGDSGLCTESYIGSPASQPSSTALRVTSRIRRKRLEDIANLSLGTGDETVADSESVMEFFASTTQHICTESRLENLRLDWYNFVVSLDVAEPVKIFLKRFSGTQMFQETLQGIEDLGQIKILPL